MPRVTVAPERRDRRGALRLRTEAAFLRRERLSERSCQVFAPGEKLVVCFRPFLEQLASSDLSLKTIQKHVDNLWALGGDLIHVLNETPSLRKVPVERLVSDSIQDGGPLLYHCDSEEQQRSFESTCRKLHRFLKEPAR